MLKLRDFIAEEKKIESLEKKIQAKSDAISLARERRKMKGQNLQSQREIKLSNELGELRQQLHMLKNTKS